MQWLNLKFSQPDRLAGVPQVEFLYGRSVHRGVNVVLWLELLLCLAVIGYAGYFLSRYSDIIAEKTGMSAS